jgi:hypothetical protein
LEIGARFHPLLDNEEEEEEKSSIEETIEEESPINHSSPLSQSACSGSSPAPLSQCNSDDETHIEEDVIEQYEDLKVRFNLVLADLKPNSSHTFKSLTPFERSRVHVLAEKAGLVHWTGQQRVHPDKPYKIKVVVVSNDDGDRVKGRQLIATAVQATTVVDIPLSPSVAEVLARPIVKDTSPWICKDCERNDFKSKAGSVDKHRKTPQISGQESGRMEILDNFCRQLFPLRTNLELTRIFRMYNGSNDIQVIRESKDTERFMFVYKLVSGKMRKTWTLKSGPPLNLAIKKGSNYLAASRAFIDTVINNNKSRQLIDWSRTMHASV